MKPGRTPRRGSVKVPGASRSRMDAAAATRGKAATVPARRHLLVPAATARPVGPGSPARRPPRPHPGPRPGGEHRRRRRRRGRLRALRQRRAQGRADRARDRAAQGRRVRGRFVWIGLHDPTSEVVDAVGGHFELHPLAMEDAVHAHQRPKLELFGDSLFAVLKTVRYVDSERARRDRRDHGVRRAATSSMTVRHGEGSPLARACATSSRRARPARDRPERGAPRDRRPDRRRLRDRRSRASPRHRGGRGGGVLGQRRQSGRAHLQAQARGARVQARGHAAADAGRAPLPAGACRSTRELRSTSATSTTTSMRDSSASRASTTS